MHIAAAVGIALLVRIFLPTVVRPRLPVVPDRPLTYYVLRALALLGTVWDIRRVPAHVVENRPKRSVARATAQADDRRAT